MAPVRREPSERQAAKLQRLCLLVAFATVAGISAASTCFAEDLDSRVFNSITAVELKAVPPGGRPGSVHRYDGSHLVATLEGADADFRIAEDGDNIQFCCGMSAADAKLRKADTWNRGERLTGAYIAVEGDPIQGLGLACISHRLSPRSGGEGGGCKACDRGPRKRIQGDTLRRATERNVAGADISGDAAESR
jgi:hypothetical protein